MVLEEFDEKKFSKARLPTELGHALWKEYGRRIQVEFPSPKTGDRWVLKNLGYVGVLPLSRDHTLSLQPKVPISNVFRMLEYAYRLDIFHKSDDVIGAESMQEVYESLARVLARRICDRGRSGLHRCYVGREQRLGVVRGRVDLRRLSAQHPDPRLFCQFEERTPDHADNQILLYALDRIVRSRLCREQARRETRNAYRLLRGAVSLVTFAEREIASRTYHRLNQDYRGLHALARFFVVNTGPKHGAGDEAMTPFLMDMPRLFEEFVAAWLKEHLPSGFRLIAQETGTYDSENQIRYRVDIVLYDGSGRPFAVVDTKYKRETGPASDDIAQVVTYATKKGCEDAILVYPHGGSQTKPFAVGNVKVKTMGFPLDGDLKSDGQRLMERIVRGASRRAWTCPAFTDD